MKNKWISLGRALFVIFTLILFANAYLLFREIRQDISYHNRAYGLSSMDDHFNDGEYYEIYTETIKNSIVDDEPYVDTGEYEAFGRFYYNFLMAKTHPDDPVYREQMDMEKAQISLTKILKAVERLEEELEN